MGRHCLANVRFLDTRIPQLQEQRCLDTANPHCGSVPLTEPNAIARMPKALVQRAVGHRKSYLDVVHTPHTETLR